MVDDSDVKNFSIRVKSIPKTQSIFIRNIRNNHLNKFFSIEGYIKARTDVRPQITSTKFECRNCGNILTILQMGKEMKFPSKCSSCGTKGFTILNKELIDGFAMVVEESPDSLEFGTQLRRINVFVKGDLTESRIENKLYQGVKVNIIGILKETEQTKKTQIDYFLDANYIHILDECIDIKISDKEKKLIESLSKEKGILKKLANEMFSSVHGHDKIKEALILQSFGGVTKETETKRIRGNIHLLLIGDSGVGKSTLLDSMAKFQPKVRFAVGGAVSGVGFLGSLVRDELLGGWSFEAGVLPLAHKGILLLDETDKATDEDRNALHGPMEKGIVKIDNGPIHTTLLCETTILAAANPKFGKFDSTSRMTEQINLPPTLITRFDCIFVMKDIYSEAGDIELARTILTEENKKKEKEITYELMKKYILYAKTIDPKISNALQELIARKYTNIRKRAVNMNDENAFPISPRQVPSIKRLAQAHARVRLSKEVEKEDVDYAFKLVEYYLSEVGVDLITGEVDVEVIGGVSTSERKLVYRIRDIIEELEDKLGKLIPEIDVVSEIKKEYKDISESRIFEALEKLKTAGDIFYPKKNMIQQI